MENSNEYIWLFEDEEVGTKLFIRFNAKSTKEHELFDVVLEDHDYHDDDSTNGVDWETATTRYTKLKRALMIGDKHRIDKPSYNESKTDR